MKRCKHKNGTFYEVNEENLTLGVCDGVMDDAGHSIMEFLIVGYQYTCRDCGKHWTYRAYPKLKWLQKIHDQLGVVSTNKE